MSGWKLVTRELYAAGRAWVEGRAELGAQKRDGKPRPLVATRLMQLPATNEIRI